MKLQLDTPVRYIKGVGPERAKTFAKFGVHTVQDLLEYYPFRWEFLSISEQDMTDIYKWKAQRS